MPSTSTGRRLSGGAKRNGGTEPVGASTGGALRDGDSKVGRAEAGGILDPGECGEVSRGWPADQEPPQNESRDVDVAVDPDREILECREGNNAARVEDVGCATIE